MRWIKKGLLFKPDKKIEWMKSHAQVPTALIKEDRIRIYFSSRPQRNLSLTSYIDLDINNFHNILYVEPNPILKLGEIGSFDEHGIMPSSVIEMNKKIYFYYSGWSRCSDVPYRNYTGLAISNDGGSLFKKISKNPIIKKEMHEPYSATSPFVIYENKFWHMWYCSGTDWFRINNELVHTYDIKYAHSNDGINWITTNKPVIKQINKYEAITRPTIIEIDGIYHMWFCYRGSRDFRGGKDSYQIGYAHSNDLKIWERNDDYAGISCSNSGWDSEMIAYPNVIKLNNKIIMFYNGNNFGADGFGYALLQE